MPGPHIPSDPSLEPLLDFMSSYYDNIHTSLHSQHTVMDPEIVHKLTSFFSKVLVNLPGTDRLRPIRLKKPPPPSQRLLQWLLLLPSCTRRTLTLRRRDPRSGTSQLVLHFLTSLVKTPLSMSCTSCSPETLSNYGTSPTRSQGGHADVKNNFQRNLHAGLYR